MNKQISLEAAMEAVSVLLAVMRSVTGFKLPEATSKGIMDAAGFIELGDEKKAIDLCGKIVSAGRTILGAFLRFSVVDKFEMSGENIGELKQESHFGKEIRLRAEEGYGEDIVARMKKFMGELIDAVREETSTDFTRRVAAYNMMQVVLEESWQEQTRRDQRRALEVKHGKKAKSSKQTIAVDPALLAASQNVKREELIQKRVATAASFRSLAS